MACGEACTFVLTSDGHVYSWGSGGEGRLGLGDEKDARLPKRIKGPLLVRPGR